ncbi:MAG TPA: VWA domain-containing protein, partial [Candidatus Dormibacteraeota bacterium]|nr:VWA domain-containing protein [Candidatus Dormibacteraeota bacterium]
MAAQGTVLPFTALVGQDRMKLALVLNAVNPAIGGVLIRGQKGTAKSTAVRALARLLPDVDVVAGCRYGCPPDEPERHCAECVARAAAGERLPRLRRRMRVVELPVNASEDRVVGAIDIEAAIRLGERRFEPGVLAEANRNILYVDEVNLLDDHLVDVLLDAAATGQNIVEREGVSVVHPSRFILVGTMNPEEGELRPQLLDRFGLCVDVAGLRGLDERVAVIEQAWRRTRGDDLGAEADADERERAAAIEQAVALLPLVEVAPSLRRFISGICVEAGAVGHRADIVIDRTARTLRALREAFAAVRHEAGGLERDLPADALAVRTEDAVEAAEMALRHRRTERATAQPPPDASPGEHGRPSDRVDDPRTGAQTSSIEDSDRQGSASTEGEAGEGGVGQAPERIEGRDAPAGAEQLFDGSTFTVRRITLPRDRRTRRTAGKRSVTRSGDRRGRYVRSTSVERTTDLAFDATVRAAAPHQAGRLRELAERGGAGPALLVERQDLRQKVRQRRTGTLIVFVVDASASMDAEQRMQATKGAVLSLLRDAYVRRDKVSLVVFSGRTARIVLRPTSSVDLAESRLHRLAVGGTTPLTHGLVAGLKLIRTERLRD